MIRRPIACDRDVATMDGFLAQWPIVRIAPTVIKPTPMASCQLTDSRRIQP
jgi:hypothetical protein